MFQSVKRIICSVAPVRICDLGGWTDTWFAGHGAVCNLAVVPGVEVQATVAPRGDRPAPVTIAAADFGEQFALAPGDPGPPRHALLAAAVAEIPPPADVAIELRISSAVPAGCSTGTSAAVCVALLGALDRLRGGHATAHEIAYAAHRVETERLGLQSGIQDQLAAAYGGASFIEMFRYPHASVSPIPLAPATRYELERRLLLIFLGKSHSSSAIHEKVIAELEDEGASSPRTARLRGTAYAGRDALAIGDLAALGAAMIACTEGQIALHPALVSAQARALIAVAQRHGAIGWKVNGAGGDGGSLTLLCDPAPGARQRLAQALAAADPLARPIPITLSQEGLRVWEGHLKADI